MLLFFPHRMVYCVVKPSIINWFLAHMHLLMSKMNKYFFFYNSNDFEYRKCDIFIQPSSLLETTNHNKSIFGKGGGGHETLKWVNT